MEDYSFIDDLLQIRGVISFSEKTTLETVKRHLLIDFDMGSQDEGDLDYLYKILKNQKLVDWTVDCIKSEKVNL